MRNVWRLVAFDVLAPLAAIAALLVIGIMLGWPRWWVVVCTVLVLLIVEGVAINFWLLRRDSVTVGTDDDGPGLRLAVVAVCAAALVAAVAVGYTRWTTPDRDFHRDAAEVVRIATGMAEATATFSPGSPSASLDRATAMIAPEKLDALKEQYTKASADLAQRHVTARAQTLSAGVEAIGPSAALVAVILRVTQEAPGQPAQHASPALHVALTKQGGRWLVLDWSPAHSR